jgi:hypothetical protein
MTKKQKKVKTTAKKINPLDFSGWNFIIFLTLSFILLVVVLSAMRSVSQDVRTRAGLECPKVSLPNPNGCPTGWKLITDANNCPGFSCEIK